MPDPALTRDPLNMIRTLMTGRVEVTQEITDQITQALQNAPLGRGPFGESLILLTHAGLNIGSQKPEQVMRVAALMNICAKNYSADAGGTCTEALAEAKLCMFELAAAFRIRGTQSAASRVRGTQLLDADPGDDDKMALRILDVINHYEGIPSGPASSGNVACS